MKINPVILRDYDIRGKYPDELTPEAAERIGNAFLQFVRKKRRVPMPAILIARDIRASSDLLRQRLMEGLLTAGAEVIDIGVATTPQFYLAIEEKKGIDAGIMITASHNPPEYNGFKFSLKDEGEIGRDEGLQEVMRLARGSSYKAKHFGKLQLAKGENTRYVSRLKKIVPEIAPLRAIVDAGGGSTSFILPELLSKYPVLYKPIFFSPDPLFRDHSPNPLDPTVNTVMQKELKAGKYQVGVAFDADGDRAAFFDERGARIRPDVIFALLARKQLEVKPHSKFIYEVTRGRFLEPFITTYGGSLQVSKVGGIYIRKLMAESGALLGGELAGHIYHKELLCIDAALLTMLKVFRLVAASRRPLSELARSVTEAKTRQIMLHTPPNPALKKIRERYKDAITSMVDGLSVEFPHWWFNIRKSNTERLIRLTVEADSEREVEQRIKEIKRLIA